MPPARSAWTFFLAPLVVTACDGCEKRSTRAPSAASAAETAETTPAPATSASGAPVTCRTDTSFPSPLQVPEASGAAEVELVPGVREMLVVSDSGDNGAALAIKIPDGPTRALTLSLDPGASDDLEGIAWRGGHLYTLTSSGAVRRYTPDGKGGLGEDGKLYPLGPEPYSCKDMKKVNCGKNYEGLCLREVANGEVAPRCAGYAASKKEGALYCLVFRDEKLVVDEVRKPIPLAIPKDSLSDCAFGAWGGPAQGTLVVTTNIHGGSTTYVVDEASGTVHALDVGGTPSNEAVAIDRDGALYQMMDDNGDESLALRMTCTGWK